jgi:HEPN domain-containing protein
MHDDARPWIRKAEGDFAGAQILAKRRSTKTAHLTCFACQQAAEKYLKGYLVENNVRFSKTHALVKDLLPMCEKVDREFKVLLEPLKILDPYAVEARYPGEETSVSEVPDALRAAKVVRRFVRAKLGLERQRSLL